MTEAVARSRRLSADDWAREALEQIAETGVSSVAVEPLARRLGVTKGSFYWHFPSREALLQAASSVGNQGAGAGVRSLEKVPIRANAARLFQLSRTSHVTQNISSAEGARPSRSVGHGRV